MTEPSRGWDHASTQSAATHESRAPEPEQHRATASLPLAGLATVAVRRSRASGARDPLGGTEVEPDIASTLVRRRGAGAPLPQTVADPVGNMLGTDLSKVRIHNDVEADRISRSMQATAFTYGQDVYFTSGSYSPGTSSGQRLLAHELAHVAQDHATVQRSATGAAPTIGHAGDPAELEADAVADQVLDGLRHRAASDSGDDETAHGGQLSAQQGGGVGALRRQAARATPGGGGVVRRGYFDDFVDTVSGWFGFGADAKKKGTSATEDTKGGTKDEYPKTVTVGKGAGEKVAIEKDGDQAEAEAIILELEKTYGIELSAPTTIEAIKQQYSKVMASELAKLQAGVWKMKELRGLKAAVKHFAPILGPERAKSTVADKAQGVTSIGRLKQAIDRNNATGKVDNSTMGEYFAGKKAVGLFDTVTDLSDSRYIAEGKTTKDNEATLEANSIHEMSHGLIEPLELANWIKEMDYWTDKYTPSGAKDAESPPTRYGQTGGAGEDLAESVAIFFINQPMLKKVAPKREAFLAKMVAGWTPATKSEVIETSTTAKGTEEPAKELVGTGK